MGYRGTLEEYSKKQFASCVLSGIYDKVGDGWREPVNAPNGFLTRLYYNGKLLSTLACEPEEHNQGLNLSSAVHKREAVATSWRMSLCRSLRAE
jgi:nigerose phosphorylase